MTDEAGEAKGDSSIANINGVDRAPTLSGETGAEPGRGPDAAGGEANRASLREPVVDDART